LTLFYLLSNFFLLTFPKIKKPPSFLEGGSGGFGFDFYLENLFLNRTTQQVAFIGSECRLCRIKAHTPLGGHGLRFD
jgi:hypothetical protein